MFVVFASGQADATLVVTFDDPDTQGVDYRFEDQDFPGDINPIPGVMSIVVTDGASTGLEIVATALSKPFVPRPDDDPDAPVRQNIVIVSDAMSYPGSLTISVTDTDFDLPNATVGDAAVTGSIAGGTSVNVGFFGDTQNGEFEQGFEIVSVDHDLTQDPDLPYTDLSGPANPVGSLTMSAVIDADQGFDGNLLMQLRLEEGPAGTTTTIEPISTTTTSTSTSVTLPPPSGFRCCQPASSGDIPTVSDCLLIMNVAVFIYSCPERGVPTCICDPASPFGIVTVTDALVCLQAAVALPAELNCPCDVTTTTMPADDCGNGTVDPGEDCDGGECCAQDCTFEPAETPCGSSENTDCSNPDSCNANGTCLARNEPNGTSCNTDPCGNEATCQGGQCTCPSTTTTTMPPDSVCNEQLCAGDETLAQECETFVEACLVEEIANEEECLAGGLFICEGGACGQDFCATDETLEQECRTFLDTCITPDSTQPDVEACVGAAILKCQEEPIPDDVCNQLLCMGDETRSQQCETFVAACLADTANEEECAGGGLFICSGGVCGRGICAGSETLEQECQTFLGLCLADASPHQVEACIALAFAKCSEFNP